MAIPTFTSFGKIPRLSNLTMTVTEKIDGTNAAVLITEDGGIYAQSRKRFITPEDDNYGFAAWVAEHERDLLDLGPGTHFGEWWGQGIQRNYGLDERRFSLFNTSRWGDPEVRPAFCDVVPVLAHCPFHQPTVEYINDTIDAHGSQAAPGFKNPEGVMVFIHELGQYVKAPLEQAHKGQAAA